MERSKSKVTAGSSGFGKSYILGAEIEVDVLDEGWFSILIDDKGDHVALAEQLGFLQITNVTADEIDDLSIETCRELILFAIRKGYNGIRIEHSKTDADVIEKRVQMADMMARAALSLPKRYKIRLDIEELFNFARSQNLGGRPTQFRGVMAYISQGRSLNKKFTGTCQNLSQVHKQIYGVCNNYMLFQTDKGESDYEKITTNCSPELERAIIDACLSLEPEDRQYVAYDKKDKEYEIRSSDDINRRTPHSG